MNKFTNKSLRSPATPDLGTPDPITDFFVQLGRQPAATSHAAAETEPSTASVRSMLLDDWTLEFDDAGEPSVHFINPKTH